MQSYDEYTAELENDTKLSQNVLFALKKYQTLGKTTFSYDLGTFLRFNMNHFEDEYDRDMLKYIILTIRENIETYDEREEQVNGAIHEMERHPEQQVNPFACNLYVMLSGNDWVSSYEDEVHYMLESLSNSLEDSKVSGD